LGGADLSGADLSGLDLAGVDLTDAILRRDLLFGQMVYEESNEALILGWLAEEGFTVFASQLLFRASRDGWRARDFHRHCDGRGRTLVLVRSTTGHLFGGYASKSWESRGKYAAAPSSFLFCLTAANGNSVPAKMGMKVRERGKAMYFDENYGPVFGGGDLTIVDKLDLVVVVVYCQGVQLRKELDLQLTACTLHKEMCP
jgi:hypothetical protein